MIEVTTFRLAAGVDEPAFVAVDEEARTGFLYRQAGIVRATTARDGEGGWVTIVLWGSDEEAAAARSAADGDPAWQACIALVDAATVAARRFHTLD